MRPHLGPTLPPGGSERVVVRVAPGRVCVGAVSRPRACFGAAAAGGLSREEEVSVSFWAWRGPVLAPLTEALRLNYEAGCAQLAFLSLHRCSASVWGWGEGAGGVCF